MAKAVRVLISSRLRRTKGSVEGKSLELMTCSNGLPLAGRMDDN
jgi:hypothetical protein